MKPFVLFVALWCFLGTASAQDLPALDKKVTETEYQISLLSRKYEKQKADVDQALQRVEQAKQQGNQSAMDGQTKAAYVDTENLNQLLSQINDLKSAREQFCNSWRSAYRASVDELLEKAEQEKDKKKKAEIGKLLQKQQARNAQLCAESQAVVLSQRWRAMRVEPYDGPQEVSQKLQLLQDISREISIGLTQLDQRHQESLREKKMRERAQEFVQEGTLFNEGLSVRPGSSQAPGQVSTPNAPAPTPGGVDVASSGNSGSSDGLTTLPQPLTGTDWASGTNPEQRERDYKKIREGLVQEQKEIQQKIQEFEQKAKTLTIP